MKHIDEKLLELYVLNADEIHTQRSAIERHLEECAGCSALHAEMTAYYEEVKEARAGRDSLNSQALSLRALLVKIPSQGNVPLDRIAKTMPARVILFVLRHPVVSSAAFVGIFLLALLSIVPWSIRKDLNPDYARAKDEFLIAYNKSGEELWRKHVGPGYDAKSNAYDPEHPERVLTTVDIDGDGKSEVIGIFGWTNARLPLSNIIMCYNADGSERWKYEFHRQMAFGATQYSDDYNFRLLATGDYGRDGSINVIAVAGHVPWIPNAVVRLNAKDGSFLNEYWQTGKIQGIAHRDINADGVEEFFFSGKNSGFGRASLIVVDPRKMEGHAPLPEKDIPQGIGVGTEEYYILFPGSDLEKFWAEQNQADQVKISNDGTIEVNVVEQIRGREGGQLHYFFDSTLHCTKVLGSNGFMAAHQQLELENKLTTKINDEYYEGLRKGVLYWDGDKFVNLPTMNKHYLETLKAKLLP